MHPLVPAVLLGMARRDAFDANTKPQPPHGEFAQAVERVRRREGHAVVRADGLRQPEILEGAFEDAEGVALLRRRQRFAREKVERGVAGHRQWIAGPLIAQENSPL